MCRLELEGGDRVRSLGNGVDLNFSFRMLVHDRGIDDRWASGQGEEYRMLYGYVHLFIM